MINQKTKINLDPVKVELNFKRGRRTIIGFNVRLHNKVQDNSKLYDLLEEIKNDKSFNKK